MKQVFVLRHAEKNILTGGITQKGKERCDYLKKLLPEFADVISSEKKRCVETAKELTNHEPTEDYQANIEYETGEELVHLIKQTLDKLEDSQNALIVSHSPCIGPAKILLQLTLATLI